MVDAFESSDLQKLQNALNEANAETNKQMIRKADIEKKDDEYNERLSELTEPFAQELLRKPVEDLPKGIITGTKKAVGKGLNYLKGKAEDEITRRVGDLSERLGVPDLGSRGRSLVTRNFDSFLPSSSDLESVASKGRATLASFDKGGLDAINRARASNGRSLLKGNEPVEVDAFTGKPVKPVVTQKKPLFDIAEDDDFTSDLYDKPITHTSRLFEDRPKLRIPDAPPSLTADEGLPKTGSLESILPLSEARETLPSVDFKFKRPIQPRAKPTSVDVASGDGEYLDQLAPMRNALKTPNAPLSQRGNAIQLVLSDEGKPPVSAVPIEKPTPPTGEEPTLSSGQASEDSGLSGTTRTRVVSRDIEGASNVAKDVSTGTEDLAKAGGKALGEFAETDAELGGPEDVLGDIISGVAGLATLFGGVFGKHHTETPVAVATNPTSQQGVY